MKRIWHSKIIIWILILTLMGGTSLQAATTTVQRSDIPFQEMKYERVDAAQVDQLIKEGQKLVEINNVKQIYEWDYKYGTLYHKVIANAQLAYLYYELDNTDPYFYNEYIYCIDLVGTMKSEYLSIFEGDKDELSSDMKKYYELNAQRKELENQYNNLDINIRIPYKGAELTLTEIVNLKTVDKEEKRKLAYEDWYNAYNEQAGEIFLNMVKLDNQMAKLAGYNSAAEYMYEQYSRDYTPMESKKFASFVKTYVPGTYQSMEALSVGALKELIQYTYKDEDTVINNIGDNFINKYPKLQEAYSYLKKYKLYDIVPNSNKVSGGLTTYLSGYEEPFILLNYSMDYQTVSSLIHEFGHFNFEYTTGNYAVSLDLGETYSQGLEVLAFPYHDTIMGSKELGEAIRINIMTDIVRAIIDGCVYDEFQQEVYQNPDMTVQQLNSLYAEIAGEYGLTVNERQWVEVEHNFEMPFYYLSYAMSAIAALEIWQQSTEDYDAAMQTYYKLIETGTEYDFQQAIQQAGMSNPFSEETVKKVMSAIRNYFELQEQQQVNKAA